ncbi:MAG: 4-hydroxy-3-methylbut-2-enyl diphosphate reductase [Phycisphaerales bacterium]|jgi:4-hydroxy-3-methylbut-2-enyl diphosphate reductase|nr:4-hydroxy-3-methylbut-2-enyl diphosphate reductase [Phycisphaerales bacterium]
MRIKLSNPRGFCAGVRMAVDIVDQMLDVINQEEPLYVYHEIVHNKHVVKRLRERGATFVEHIEDIPENAIVVFSAHGVSPRVKKLAANRNLTCIDATCPLVTKVHAEAIRYSKRGWQILLIGHKNHQEVVGTQGEAPNAIQIVETTGDIPNLQIDDKKKLVYLTQTTLSTDDAEIIISALRARFPEIHAPPTDDICYATTNRQHAVREDASDADLVLVVGSQNSSNSLRLTEIAETVGTPAFLLDDVSKLDPSWLTNVNSILITAGASAPEHLVLELIEHLTTHYGGKLEGESTFDEGMTFSMPISLTSFLNVRDVTSKGKNL